MKTIRLIFISCLTFVIIGVGVSQDNSDRAVAQSQTVISVSSTHDLMDLTSAWVKEYGRLKPEVKIQLEDVGEGGEALRLGNNLCFISNKSLKATQNVAIWQMVLGRDVTVAVINAKNPYLNELYQKGISAEAFSTLFINQNKRNWGSVVNDGHFNPIRLYISDNEEVKSSVVSFLNLQQIQAEGVLFGKPDAVVSAVQKDIYAIGFCKLIDVQSDINQDWLEDIRPLPIDKNANGRIDFMEDIYKDPAVFLRAVWIGKFPKALYSNIFAVSNQRPVFEAEVAFLNWILTDGQSLLTKQGFCSLTESERHSQLAKISEPIIIDSPEKDAFSWMIIPLSILVIFILLSIVINRILRHKRSIRNNAVGKPIAIADVFDEHTVDVAGGVFYSKAHTWAFMERDGTVKTGIDDFLQHTIGLITRVEMKKPGEMIKKGEHAFSIIQAGKQLQIYSPVSGIIKEQNAGLDSDPSFLNSSPYCAGWVYMIEPSDWHKETQTLSMADKYKKYLPTEFIRLKDFLAHTINSDVQKYANPMLQDGGALKDNVLSGFGPEIWEDFQTNFLDKSK
jgi:glycine cleavage system H lipoate-binding protein/ABC-type phosphate transport system substrate-binding protein